MDEGWQAESGGSPWLSPTRAARMEPGFEAEFEAEAEPAGAPAPEVAGSLYSAPPSYTAPPYTATQPHPGMSSELTAASRLEPVAPDLHAAPPYTAAQPRPAVPLESPAAPVSDAGASTPRAVPPYTASEPHPGARAQSDTADRIDPADLAATLRPAAAHPTGGTVEDAERILAQAVDASGATPDMYALGTAADGAVCLVPEDRRWSVYLADGPVRRFPGSFDDPELAAVHFAGVLLLLAQERGTLSYPSDDADDAGDADLADDFAREAADAEVAVHSDLLPTLALAPDVHADPLAAFLAGPPIQPLAGEPPATLYAERRLTVLTPGTEIDRFGDQEGNTVYAARTRFANRSLPADFADRDYRVYRVVQPLRTLTGRAIPWFGQPGGGAVYLLPSPIRQLLREGWIVEIPAATVSPV